MLIPFLLFFIAMHSTYAYFTATASEKKSTASTATIQILLTEPERSFVDIYDNIISSEAADQIQNQVLPGNTIYFNGTLINKGNAECYVLIKFTIDITKAGSSTTENFTTEYYSFANNEQIEITEKDGEYSNNVGIIPKNNNSVENTSDERDFTLSFEIDGKRFTDAYQGATLNYSIKAYAIQTVHIPDGAAGATALLMEYINQ